MSAPRTQAPLNGGYDQNLLAAAPEASKAAKQEGYNVDLLDESRQARNTSSPPSGPRITEYEGARSKENYRTLAVGAPAVPFWRTRKGMIALAVLGIVIVGAVVGGAVGGTVGKGSKVPDVQGQSVATSSSASKPSSSTSAGQPGDASKQATQTSGT